MIKVSSKKNKYTYNVYHLVKAFFPNEEIIQNVDEKQESLVALNLPGGSCFSIALEEVEAAAGDLSEMETEEAKEQAIKIELTRLLYRYLEQQTRTTLAWGTRKRKQSAGQSERFVMNFLSVKRKRSLHVRLL